uniref:Hikeshi-like domain-containing protein n=1 Tax=Aureoumbra lagunensis TaxID=44058 RepID=A0A7S3NKR4_9STRA|mmetsp:Transcript_1027/g.1281  ORF Transcript_1027/g.1281 Transcript_1027/m.1281 type:complete len:193 (-) Transcript_1027:87-665(-)
MMQGVPQTQLVQMFGVVIAGRPAVTDFTMVDASKCVTTLTAPGEVSEICFFLLPGAALPPNTSAVLYYTVDGVGWTVLGAVGERKPSGIFRTPWHTQLGVATTLQLGVSLESNDVVDNLNLTSSGVEDRRAFARKIAQDLFDFLASFSRPSSDLAYLQANPAELLIVPTSVIDRWIIRFDEKYQRDPNFYLK